MTIIYIIGAGGTGSTQLAANLAVDLNGFDGGELMRLQRYKFSLKKCTCGVHYNKCEFWARIDPAKTSQVPRSSLLYFICRAMFNSAPNYEERHYVESAIKQYSEIMRLSDAQCLVDSSKSWKRWLFLHSSEQVEIITVYIKRSVFDYIRTKRSKGQKRIFAAFWKHFRVNFATKYTLQKMKHNQAKIIELNYNEIEYDQLLKTLKLWTEHQDSGKKIPRHAVGGNRNRFKIETFNAKR